MAAFDNWFGEGRLLLETDELVFRGAARWRAPLSELQDVGAQDGWLEVEHGGSRARFDLGNAADRWAHAIRHPKRRIDKLEVKATSRVALVDIEDEDFLRELRERTPFVLPPDAGELDFVFVRVRSPAELGRLADLRQRIKSAGAVWILTPKGKPELGHEPVVTAAKAAGLIDTKTARYSATHTALKLVIPRAQRPPVQT